VLPGNHLFAADYPSAVSRVNLQTGASDTVSSSTDPQFAHRGIAIAGGTAFLTNSAQYLMFEPTLVEIDLETGARANVLWSTNGFLDGTFPESVVLEPRGAAVDPTGKVAITWRDNQLGTQNVISRLDLATQQLTLEQFLPADLYAPHPGGVGGGGQDYFSGIAFNGSGQMFATLPYFPLVVKSGPGFGGSSQSGFSWFNTTRLQPEGIAVDSTGKVWVADTGAKSVVHFDSNNGNATTAASGLSIPCLVPHATGSCGPEGIAVLGPFAFVAQPEGRRIVKTNLATNAQTAVFQGISGGVLDFPRHLAIAPDIVFKDFSDVSRFTINRNAHPLANALRLTDDAGSQFGSAFLTKPFRIEADSSFNISFALRAGGQFGSGDLASDGMAFVIHADPRGAMALGNGGGGLGFGGSNAGGSEIGISPSVAIEFDTHQNFFDPDGNHVGVMLNGNMSQHYASASFPCPPARTGVLGCLNSGTPVYVWIDYRGPTSLLQVFLSNQPVKPTAPSISYGINLDLQGFGHRAYFGFTGGTGGGTNFHEVLNWTIGAPLVPGDLDGNNQVGCSDVALVTASFGKRSGQLGFKPIADTNADGVIDVRDLQFITQKLPAGTRCP
jgi:DNA-binding beta-propeller fold protein YncE